MRIVPFWSSLMDEENPPNALPANDNVIELEKKEMVRFVK